jgi:predicted NUDIX family NTP pyrophosphohydrolase
MAKQSAGLMMYRWRGERLEVFLVHPGGPMWAGREEGAWTVPKGEYVAAEPPLAAARREFNEETGFAAPDPLEERFEDLGEVRQKSGKRVRAWAFAGDCDPDALASNLCEIEWPPRSGRRMTIPEVDRGRWLGLEEARRLIRAEQQPLLERLRERLGGR